MKLPPIVLFAGATLLPFGLLWLEVFARGPFGLFALIVLTVVAGLVDHLSPQLSRPSGVSARPNRHGALALQWILGIGHIALILALPFVVQRGACLPDLHPCTCIICRTDHTPQCA
jgi:hypothetical protein